MSLSYMPLRSRRSARVLAASAIVLLSALGVTTDAGAEARAGSDTGSQVVRVVTDETGQRLQVDGRDFMVLGLNWGYMPIGENYSYSLWSQPDDVIIDALAREMPLLQDMGVNALRQYVGVPARWVRYIYEHYGIYTILNHAVARWGYTLDGVWYPTTDYSDPRLREAVKAEIRQVVEEFKDTPGLLMWLLGNENNYGLSWSSFEIEALPEGERNAAMARYLYSLMEEVTVAIQGLDPDHPVAMANGDIQYLDLIAEECTSLDVFGTNVYRGISVRDLYQRVDEAMGIPVLQTEFGSDAWNAREMREDQAMQARYVVGQWREIYEQSAGKGRVGNAIGGLTFQWSDGWWKFKQTERLDIHDTNASWPNGGYVEDFVEGENNMNEEWWGITAKGMPDERGIYEVYPRAAYYALRKAYTLDPYGEGVDLGTIRAHFNAIRPAAMEVEARGSKAMMQAESTTRVRVSGVRMEFETFYTGGDKVSTPEQEVPGSASQPAYTGFDHLESFFFDVEATPTETVRARVSVNILGNVARNPIDEIFYENRGRTRSVTIEGEEVDLGALERTKIYQAEISWDDRWFTLDGFYRTGHLHWQYEGDFFGLYRNAYYGENIDIYNGAAPNGFEMAGKRWLSGLKLAYGPELWWGANPALLLKYQRNILGVNTTFVYQDDIAAARQDARTSNAVPQPETRKLSGQIETTVGPFGLEGGALWAGEPLLNRNFQIVEEVDGETKVFQDAIKEDDLWGFKGKLTLERGIFRWYGQGAYMGLVSSGGPTEIVTYTGWALKESGSGNQKNAMSGITLNLGNIQLGPNVLWQKPIVGPIPGDAPAPARPRNILDDPFAVLDNREMLGGELMLVWDPTPETWMWAWDNEVREDARLAGSLSFILRDYLDTRDVTVYVAEDGVTFFPFNAAPPADELWEVRLRLLSRVSPKTRVAIMAYGGLAQPRGWDVTGENTTLNRKIERYGVTGRLSTGRYQFDAFAKFNDWGPYDYHQDFNLTFPVQLMGDLSYSLSRPLWFYGQRFTRLGMQAKWRSLDVNSNRYDPTGSGEPVTGFDEGNEWEIRTYVHVSL